MTITFEKTGDLFPALLNTDAIIVNANINGIELDNLLVDGGSACDLLPLTTFKQMNLKEESLEEFNGSIRGVTGHDTPILGKIKLPMTLGNLPLSARHSIEFLVADVSSDHDGIIGRPSQAIFEAAVSIRHRTMKFITPYGVGEVQSG